MKTSNGAKKSSESTQKTKTTPLSAHYIIPMGPADMPKILRFIKQLDRVFGKVDFRFYQSPVCFSVWTRYYDASQYSDIRKHRVNAWVEISTEPLPARAEGYWPADELKERKTQ